MAVIDEHGRSTKRRVPFSMQGPLHVPAERYFDREFFEFEKKHLWPCVWQMACRLEELPNPGDFVEYEICDQSIMIVRQRDNSLKGFFNACRHRATELCKGSGRFAGGQIVCPFHGWRWNIDGSNSFVYGAEGFAPECIRAEDIRLQECLVGTWGGCVWVNMDTDARPLEDALAPAAQYLDNVGAEDMRVKWWKEVLVNANWKMAQEAFHEGYHVMATHPQLTMDQHEDYPPSLYDYTTFENGHARFWGRKDASKGGVSAGRPAAQFLARSRTLWEGQDAMTLERDLHVFEGMRNRVPPEEDFPMAAIKGLCDYMAAAGIPMRTEPDAMRLWGGEVFLFPNFFMLPQYENALSYRVRPYNDDPEWCRFEVWSLTMYPEGQDPGRPTRQGPFAPDDRENLGVIPRQDFSNLARQQRGVHSISFDGHRLSVEWERAISNMHEELDRYLGS